MPLPWLPTDPISALAGRNSPTVARYGKPLASFRQVQAIGNITDAYSLEVNAKDISALTAAAPRVLPGSTISIPYLANQDNDARLAAAQAVRGLGFEPMPHLAARRIASFAERSRSSSARSRKAASSVAS